MTLRVCIPTAGTGSRLGGLTKYVNKSLVGVAHRPILCHIVEQFAPDTEFVIALGHQGHLVREFVSLAYPGRTFVFCEVDPFEGPGSGLGLSLLACREHLQQPFVFISCDTLVDEPIPPPDHDWMGVADADDLAPYRTLEVGDGSVRAVCEKGIGRPGTHQAYIGLAGIHDHRTFWQAMVDGGPQAVARGEAHGLAACLAANPVRAHRFTWHDTGNPAALQATREKRRQPDGPTILEKANEAIWFVDGQAIKYSDDTRFIAHRVERARSLAGFVPEVTGATAHMYRYPMASGKVLGEVINRPLFAEFLAHCDRFWQPMPQAQVDSEAFVRRCMKFYRDKTLERVEQFYRTCKRTDGTQPINGVPMPTLASLLERVDWQALSHGVAGRWHGDFHFENILWDEPSRSFTFLDWRQDFGGDLGAGDIYYDFAKLLHGLIVNHKVIARELFTIDWSEHAIGYDMMRPQTLVECERLFGAWIESKGYDWRRVRLLTALIYLNIAALHHHPYTLFLYALGKDMLLQSLES